MENSNYSSAYPNPNSHAYHNRTRHDTVNVVEDIKFRFHNYVSLDPISGKLEKDGSEEEESEVIGKNGRAGNYLTSRVSNFTRSKTKVVTDWQEKVPKLPVVKKEFMEEQIKEEAVELGGTFSNKRATRRIAPVNKKTMTIKNRAYSISLFLLFFFVHLFVCSYLNQVGCSSSTRLAFVWPSSGFRLDLVWPSSGPRLALVWPSSDPRLDLIFV